MAKIALLTAFGPYGSGGGINPSAMVAERIAGREIGGLQVKTLALPVSLAKLGATVDAALRDHDPAIVVSLGLFPGEPAIRLERVGVNVADYWIPDNDGALLQDAPVLAGGADARLATLPIRAIQNALLDSGIPAQVSHTAGTFLCNATLYTFLSTLDAQGRGAVPCGFIHLPYLPEQAAEVLRATRRERTLEIYQRADLASMSLDMMARAVELAFAVGLGTGAGTLR